MEIITDKKKLVDLVTGARKGKVVLPQFQRSFVWSYVDVVDLLVSIFNGYYVGSFLTLKCDSENVPFDFRTIEGVNKQNEDLNPEVMILDGQQRITTLHYVLYAPEEITLKYAKYPYRFFLKLDSLVNGDFDNAIYGIRSDQSEKYMSPEWQFENKTIPFTTLQDFQSWDSWLDSYQDWLRSIDEEQYENYVTAERADWKQSINVFFDMVIPIIEIPKVKSDDEDGVAEVCAIFEKINTKGVKLSVFDLLTARLFKYKIDLHKLWEETLETYNLIDDFSEGESNPYGIFILRIIALIRGVDVKSKNLINLKPNNFENDWANASKYLHKALKRLISTNDDGFGVFDKKWMPYPPLLPVLSSVLYLIDKNNYNNSAYKAIKKWYWGSVFGERYQSAVESKTTSDFREISRYLSGEEVSIKLFTEIDANITLNELYEVKSVNRINSIYKGVMNLLAINQARDFLLHDSIEFHELDDHHIFPKAYLAKIKDEEDQVKYKDNLINTIVNKTLISYSTNRKISKKKPSDYVKDNNLIVQASVKSILKRHFINQEAYEAMCMNDYEKFVNERSNVLVKKIKSLLQI
ncbi:DUF262 domain-containing protein [Candidatus Woesebacteria bacterium]|nr:DUF262 domain-containing protein [Candidatus Woesebacteria bacterium]